MSLRPDGAFAQIYGGHEVVRGFCGLFAVLGLLLWIPDLYGYYFRVSPDQDVREEGRGYAARITAAVVVCEDVPQLAINCVCTFAWAPFAVGQIATHVARCTACFVLFSRSCLRSHMRSACLHVRWGKHGRGCV